MEWPTDDENQPDTKEENKQEDTKKPLESGDKPLPNTNSYSGSRQRLYNRAIYGLI